MTEVVSDDNWSYKSCKASVKSSPATNQHPVFLQAGCPSCHPISSVRALKGTTSHDCHWQTAGICRRHAISHAGVCVRPTSIIFTFLHSSFEINFSNDDPVNAVYGKTQICASTQGRFTGPKIPNTFRDISTVLQTPTHFPRLFRSGNVKF